MLYVRSDGGILEVQRRPDATLYTAGREDTVPWWGWIRDKIDAIPSPWYDVILIAIAAIAFGAVFLPKPVKLTVIAWLVSP